MNWGQRFARAAQAFRQPDDQKAPAKAASQALTIIPGSELHPHWEMLDTRSYIESGFNLNSIIYSAVMYKVRSLKSAPLRAYTGEHISPQVLEDTHPLARLLQQPNPYQSANDFSALNTVFYNVTGNAFIYFQRPKPGALPTAMYTLRPDGIQIVPGKEGETVVLGYVYTPEGRGHREGFPILAENMLHIKQPNPNDPLNGAGWGWSPLAAAAQSANVDNDVTKFLKTFFQKGAMFQNAVSFDLPMDDKEISEARQKFEEIYGGAENWYKVAFFGHGARISRLSPTFDEMGFDSVDARSETRILGPLGVPAVLIGARIGLERGTESNVEELRRVFWEDTMLPEIGDFEAGYMRYLAGQDGSFPQFDLSQVPALRRDVTKLTAAALQMWQMGTPATIAYQTVGLSVPEYPGSDRPNIPQPSPLIPIASKGRKVAIRAPYDPRAMQTKMDALAVSWESRYGAAAERSFEQDKREVLALVSDTATKARQHKAMIDWRVLDQSVSEYLKGAGDEAWRSTFVPLLSGVMAEVGKEWAGALGIQFDVRNLEGEAFFQDYILNFAQPIMQTTDDDIHAAIAQALAEGWSVPQMQDRLGQIFDQYMKGDLTAEDLAWFKDRLPAYRKEMIARTETMRAEGAGAFNLGKSWGVETKSWLATHDNHTRETHQQAEQEYGENGSIGPIPMDEPFMIGGSPMMYPLDPAGPVEEFVNCRCTILLYKAETPGTALPTA